MGECSAMPCRKIMGLCLTVVPRGAAIRRTYALDSEKELASSDTVFQVFRARIGYMMGQPVGNPKLNDVYAEEDECRQLTEAEETWVRENFRPRRRHTPL